MKFTIGLRLGAAVILLGAARNASAQTAPKTGPVFEVAVIKPAKPFVQTFAEGGLVGMKVTAGHLSFGQASLSNLILAAYDIKRFQLEGPEWVTDAPDPTSVGSVFDIEAKFPDGATADQIPLMLQALLRDRFKLVIRKGSKDADSFTLTVAKGGPKFPVKKPVDGQAGPVLPDTSISTTEGKNGQVTLTTAGSKVTMVPGQGRRFETSTLAGLIDGLRLPLQLPVIDKTGLTGEFDISILIPPANFNDIEGGMQAVLANPTIVRQRTEEQAFVAIEKIGLKLERQKNPVETIVVVSMERAPTEN